MSFMNFTPKRRQFKPARRMFKPTAWMILNHNLEGISLTRFVQRGCRGTYQGAHQPLTRSRKSDIRENIRMNLDLIDHDYRLVYKLRG
ncbi:hypothetical protein [Rhizobium phage RHph_X2_28B]|uniref:hypothetical protein n=1 Tax=Rhizobium phage RHph_X2_28B TaxID=2836086 RepID=UPI002329518A|nr:hypothetical protein PP751_gp004 [Rhizobium phage RHph_X2_28B]QWY83456.1 hypothetical protein [Rhizobium phage RHph_X2_28B]QWY83692.1 hypothetical protein [Rhizobium phage RHph_X3_15]